MCKLSICILGGTGFVGTRLVSRLIREGHRVTVLTRNRELHKHLLVLPGLTLLDCDVYDAGALSEHFRGQDVVINLVGILNERWFGGDGFRRAHTELTRGVLQACRSAGVGRLLQMSSLKADLDAPSHYLRSKAEAEKIIREQAGDVDWTIFKPSVIFGPGDSFLNRFAAMLALIPLVFPLARPQARFQPVFVDDVIAAMVRCLRGGACSRQTYELGGPHQYTLRQVVELVASLNHRRRWIMGLPDPLGRLQAFFMNFVPGRPFSSDNYKSLTVDSVCATQGFSMLGITPQAMPGVARTYLGSFEDNARLSECRGRSGGRSGERVGERSAGREAAAASTLQR
ncbi:MAG: complex I NDUFA9 subunit family protein [Steroidobacteraceae bacterium]